MGTWRLGILVMVGCWGVLSDGRGIVSGCCCGRQQEWLLVVMVGCWGRFAQNKKEPRSWDGYAVPF